MRPAEFRLNPSAEAAQFTDIRKVSERAMTASRTLIRLDIGEPDLPESAFVVAAAQEHLAGGTHYTPAAGLPKVREAMARFSTELRATPAEPSNVVMTVGSNGGISTALFMLLEPGDEVLVPAPGFPVYPLATALMGGVSVDYHLAPESDWQPDLDEIRLLVGPRTKAIILCSPSNPIGRSIDRAVLEQIVAIARANGLVVIADEVYDQMIFEGEPLRAFEYAPDCVIGLYSFSKNYCLSGHRIGYALVPDRLVGVFIRTAALLFSCPPSTAQVAALAAVTGPQDDVAARTAIYRTRRDVVADYLTERGLNHWKPDGTFYYLVGLPAGTDSLQFAFHLLDRGVACAPGSAFGAAGNAGTAYLRLSLTKDVPVIRRGLEMVADAILELAGTSEVTVA